MSVLTEYEGIKREIGEKAYADLEVYLKFHPHVLLSDLYYKKSCWDECQRWLQSTPDYFKNSEPIYCVEATGLGLHDDFNECRFLGTKQEIEQKLGIKEKHIDELFHLYTGINKSYVSGESNFTQEIRDFTYEVFVSHSPESLKGFMECKDCHLYEDPYEESNDRKLFREFDECICGPNGLAGAKEICAIASKTMKPSLNTQIQSAEMKSRNKQVRESTEKGYER